LCDPDCGIREQAVHALVFLGDRLLDKDARDLEENVTINPNDPSLRIVLLGHYFRRMSLFVSAQIERRKHILWLIENTPELEITGQPQATLCPLSDPEAFAQAKQLWLKTLESNPTNLPIIGNAAGFFRIEDPKLSELLLKQAQSLNPGNPEWPRRLGHLYSLEVNHLSGPGDEDTLKRTLATLEHSLRLSANECERFDMLRNLAKAAFEAQEFSKAQAYASDLLRKASLPENSWNLGNAVHHGNLVLGRLALLPAARPMNPFWCRAL
jgi:hypothetical protein